jgi:hypothetical protein
MAGTAYTGVNVSKHFTATGGTGNHDTVTFASDHGLVEVMNVDGAAALYVLSTRGARTRRSRATTRR